jgi:hypothetical protein
MLIVAYVAVLEVVGIAVVVLDVRSDRRKGRALMDDLPRKVQGEYRSSMPSREASIIRRGGDDAIRSLDERLRATERQVMAIRRNYADADVDLRESLRDLLHGNIVHRLRGPALVALGVAVGLVANVAAI